MTTAIWGMVAEERAGLEAIRRVVSRLGVSTGGEVRSVPWGRGWSWWLSEVAARQGLRVTYVTLTVAGAGALAEQHGPVLTFAPEARRWVLVVGRANGGVRLAAGDDLGAEQVRSIDEVASLLGGEEASWALVEPMLPLDGLRGEEQKLEPHRRLWRLLGQEGGDLQAVVVYALMSGGLSLAVPIAVQALVNSIAFGVALQPLVVLTLVVFGALLFEGVLRVLQAHVVEGIQQRLFARVALDVAERLSRLRADVLGRAYAPELANRFFDVVTVQKAAAALLLDGVGLVLQATLGLVLLAFYHPLLLAFDMLLLVLLALLVFVVGRGAIETAVKESKEKYRVASWLEEIGRRSLWFRSHQARGFALARTDELAHGYLHYRRKHWGIFLRQIVGIRLLYALSSAALLGVGGWLVMARQLTLGQLVASELIVTAVLGGLIKFGKHLESFYDLAAAADKLGQLVDLPLEPQGAGLVPETIGERGGVEVSLRGVLLKDGSEISRRLQPGEHLAIVGDEFDQRALLEVLYGLTPPSAGAVLLDGVDVRQIDPSDLRSRVMLVRAGQCLEGTIEENLRLGNESVTAAQLHQALEAVGLLDDVLRLPEGLQTRLLASGEPLGDSQRRRLVLARALVQRPRLLLVDRLLDGLETSLIDPVLRALRAGAESSTLLVATSQEAIARQLPTWHLSGRGVSSRSAEVSS